MTRKAEDLSGKTFGKWTVIKDLDKLWSLCKCECGTTKPVEKCALKSGSSKSCGCFKKEYISKALKKYNKYDLSGSYGIGYTENGEEFLFDLEDYDLIKEYYWVTNQEGYLLSKNSKTTIRLHRLIMNCKDSKIFIDHINHNVKDNRKINLRYAKNSQNQMNAKLRSNNKSNYTGVYYNKKIKKWIANIQINKKRIFLGQFYNLEDAVKTRKKAEEKYFGEYSYSNSMRIAGEQL